MEISLCLNREKQLQQMDSFFPTHVDSVCTELAVADNLLSSDLLTVLAKMLYLLRRFHRSEHVWELLHISFVRQCCIALCAWRQQIHTAELCLFVVLFQLNGTDIHLLEQGAHSILDMPFFKRYPAILNRHLFPVIIRERKIRVLVNNLPQEFYCCFGVFLDDRCAVIANDNCLIICGQFPVVGSAATDRLDAKLLIYILSGSFACFFELSSSFATREEIVCYNG